MDEYTEVSSQGWFSRLTQSIKGVLTGIILFIIAFPLLFWNEGRAVKRAQDLTEGRGAVVSVSAESVDGSNEGKLVHLSAMATAEGTLSDPEFQVTSENTLALERVVEMYQWEEKQEKKTQKKVGGKEETVTTYSYNKTWSPRVINSSEFKQASDHPNPTSMAFQGKVERAPEVKVGAFKLGSLANSINSWSKLPVSKDLKIDAGRPLRQFDGGYYFGNDAGNPQIGDLRISFKEIKPLQVSLVAVQTGDSFTAYEGKSGSTIHRLDLGEKTADQMFEAMESENTMMLWIIRLIGFLLMMGGISAVFKPLVVMADVLPFFGNMLQFGVSVLAFVIAAPLTLITIAIGWIAYRPVIGIALLVLAFGIIAGGVMLAQKKKAA